MSVVVGPSDGARVPTRPIRKGRFEVFPDDPRESPYPDQLPEQQRVVVVGDLHGDYEALVACLRMSGCVDAADVGRWTAGPGTVMVVLGDVVDRFRAGRCAQPEAWGCHDSEWVAASGMFLTKSVGETQDEEKRVLRLLNSLASQAQEHTAGDLPAREVRRAEYTDFTTAPDAGFSKTRGDNRTVNALCEGLVWRMDVGMSRAFAYKAAAAYRLTPGLERSTRPAILLIDVKDGGGYDYIVRQWNSALPDVAL